MSRVDRVSSLVDPSQRSHSTSHKTATRQRRHLHLRQHQHPHPHRRPHPHPQRHQHQVSAWTARPSSDKSKWWQAQAPTVKDQRQTVLHAQAPKCLPLNLVNRAVLNPAQRQRQRLRAKRYQASLQHWPAPLLLSSHRKQTAPCRHPPCARQVAVRTPIPHHYPPATTTPHLPSSLRPLFVHTQSKRPYFPPSPSRPTLSSTYPNASPCP